MDSGCSYENNRYSARVCYFLVHTGNYGKIVVDLTESSHIPGFNTAVVAMQSQWKAI
jgi:hypothetical protein